MPDLSVALVVHVMAAMAVEGPDDVKILALLSSLVVLMSHVTLTNLISQQVDQSLSIDPNPLHFLQAIVPIPSARPYSTQSASRSELAYQSHSKVTLIPYLSLRVSV